MFCDPSIGRYVESDPVGLYGGVNTYTYVYGNPLIGFDPYGLFDLGDPSTWPELPWGVVDYFSGYGSYYGGLYDAAEHMVRRSGLAGECEKLRAQEEEAVLGAALRALSDPDVANKAATAAGNWAADHKAYLAGRLSAGAITSGATGIGPYGGVSLGVLAGLGNALENIKNGLDSPNDIVLGFLGEQGAADLRKVRGCGCSK